MFGLSLTNIKDTGVVVAVSGVTALNIFLSGAVTVALPTIGDDLGFTPANLQWPVTVYALANGCALLLLGRISDIVGGRNMFMAGSVWFIVWSIAAAFAPTAVAFIIFMAMLGIGAAATTPASISVLSASFPPGVKRNRAYAYLGAAQALGYMVGIVCGGLLSESSASWKAIYYAQAALGAALAILAWCVLPHDDPSRKYTQGLDWGGAFLSTAGFGLLTYTLASSTASAKAWSSSPLIPLLLVASLVSLGLFIYYQRWLEARGKAVLIPLSMFQQPGAKLGVILTAVFFGWFALNTQVYLATLLYQQVLLLDPIQTSIRFVPFALTGPPISALAAYLVPRVAGQKIMLGGLSTTLVASLLFAVIQIKLEWWAMLFPIMLILGGTEIMYTVGTLQICTAFGEDSQAVAGGLFNVSVRIGTSLGLAIASSISTSVSSMYHSRHPALSADSPQVILAGLRAGAWSCFAATAISMLTLVLFFRGIGVVGQAKEIVGSSTMTSLEKGAGNPESGNEKANSAAIEMVKVAN